MSWLWCWLLLAAVTLRQAHAAPLIADPTFTDIDLLAEASQPSEVFVAAPLRTKRTPQYLGNNCAYGGGCGGRNIFGNSNTPDYYHYANSRQQGAYNNALMYNNYASYPQRHRPPAKVVNHEHQRNGPPSASSPTSGAYHQHSSDSYSPQSSHSSHNSRHAHYSLHDYEQEPTPPQRRAAPSDSSSEYDDYDTNDYSSGYNYPEHGFHGHNSFGYRPHPPFGVPPGFNRGRHHFGPPHGWLPGFADERRPPGFNREPTPPAPTPTDLPQAAGSEPTPPDAPLTTQQTSAPIPDTTAQPVVVTVASITTSTTTTTTPDPMFDIDIRFGN